MNVILMWCELKTVPHGHSKGWKRSQCGLGFGVEIFDSLGMMKQCWKESNGGRRRAGQGRVQ